MARERPAHPSVTHTRRSWRLKGGGGGGGWPVIPSHTLTRTRARTQRAPSANWSRRSIPASSAHPRAKTSRIVGLSGKKEERNSFYFLKPLFCEALWVLIFFFLPRFPPCSPLQWIRCHVKVHRFIRRARVSCCVTAHPRESVLGRRLVQHRLAGRL